MLTRMQKLYADYLLTGMDKVEAVLKAGYGKKSKKEDNIKYLRNKANNLSANIEVKAYIEMRLAEKDESILIKQNELLQYLSDCVRGKITEKRVVVYRDEHEIIDIEISNKDRMEAAKLLFKYFNLEGKGIDNKDDKPILIDDIEPNNIEDPDNEEEDNE